MKALRTERAWHVWEPHGHCSWLACGVGEAWVLEVGRGNEAAEVAGPSRGTL